MKKSRISFLLLFVFVTLMFTHLYSNHTRFSKHKPITADESDLWYQWWDDDAYLYDRYPTAIWGNDQHLYMGGTVSWTTGPLYSYLLKWDREGNRIWYNISSLEPLEGTEQSQVTSIWGDNTNFYTCGSESGVGCTLVKWDFDSNQTWGRSIENCTGWGISGDESFIYTCGELRDSNPEFQNRSIIVSTWDKTGTSIWNRTYSIENCTLFVASMWSDESHIYVCGTVEESSDRNFILLKYTKLGVLEWDIVYEQEIVDNRALSITGDDSSLYVCGASDYNAVLFKWNKNGILQWVKEELCQSRFLDVEEQGGYLFTLGFMRPHLNHLADIYLAKWDTDGNCLWRKSWGRYDQSELGVSMWLSESHVFTVGYGSLNGVVLKWNFDGRTIFIPKPESPVIKIHEDFMYWSEISGAIEYNIYCSRTPFENTTLLAPILSSEYNSFSFSNNEVNESVYYAVTAVNGYGESRLSNLLFIEYESKTVPGMPFWGITIFSFLSICIVLMHRNKNI